MDIFVKRIRKNRIGRGLNFEKVWAIIEKNAWEARERQKEIDRQMQETDRKMEMLNEQMGGLHNSFGEMAEHLVAPGIVERFNEMGFHIKEAATHGFKIWLFREYSGKGKKSV